MPLKTTPPMIRCEHLEWAETRDDPANAKYRCKACGCSGYRDARTGKVVPHVTNRSVNPRSPKSEHGGANRRLGKRGPGGW